MAQNRETILKKLMTNYWLFENMFGKYWDDILYNSERELARRILKEAYWKRDVDRFFPAEVDMDDYERTLKTIFTYYDNTDEWTKK